MKKLFCCPALELFCCLPLWKTVLFVSSRAFSLSTPTFLLSTPAENSEATWKKATKCNKINYISILFSVLLKLYKHNYSECLCNYLICNTLKMHTYTNFSVKKRLALLFFFIVDFQLYKHHDPECTFLTL